MEFLGIPETLGSKNTTRTQQKRKNINALQRNASPSESAMHQDQLRGRNQGEKTLCLVSPMKCRLVMSQGRKSHICAHAFQRGTRMDFNRGSVVIPAPLDCMTPWLASQAFKSIGACLVAKTKLALHHHDMSNAGVPSAPSFASSSLSKFQISAMSSSGGFSLCFIAKLKASLKTRTTFLPSEDDTK